MNIKTQSLYANVVKEFCKQTQITQDEIFGIIPLEDGQYTIMTKQYESYLYTEYNNTLEKIKRDDSNLSPAKKEKAEFLTEEEKESYYLENKNLIYFTIKRIDKPPKVEMDELEGYAILGFIKALNTYNKANGAKFSTYAVKCMMNELYYFLRKTYKHINDSYLDDIIAGDGENAFTFGDIYSVNSDSELRTRELTPEEEIELKELREILNRALETLDSSEQYVILHRYGLNGAKVQTQIEIAEVLSMSQANISKLERNILRKLRLYLHKARYIYDAKTKKIEEPIGEPLEDYSYYRELPKFEANIKDKLSIMVRVSELYKVDLDEIEDIKQTTSKEWYQIIFKNYNLFYGMYNNITDRVIIQNRKLNNQERFICLCLKIQPQLFYTTSAFQKPELIPEISREDFLKLFTKLSKEESLILQHLYHLNDYEILNIENLSKKYNLSIEDIQKNKESGINKISKLIREYC